MRIHHIALGVKNLDESIKFYQQCAEKLIIFGTYQKSRGFFSMFWF